MHQGNFLAFQEKKPIPILSEQMSQSPQIILFDGLALRSVEELLVLLLMQGKAFILAIIAGFFMFQPGFIARQPGKCGGDHSCMQQTCTANEHCKKKQSKENRNSNGCNPFMACWCGNFFVVERPFGSSAPITGIDRDFVSRDEKDETGIASECWHPPEMC